MITEYIQSDSNNVPIFGKLIARLIFRILKVIVAKPCLVASHIVTKMQFKNHISSRVFRL